MTAPILRAALPWTEPWGKRDLGLVLAMWMVMMVAMMIPSAAPMILTFATFQRRRREAERTYVGIGVFLLGYLIVGLLFGAGATLAQWGLHQASLLSPAMKLTGALAGGAVLIGAGIFQFTPLKQACLSRCSSPLSFVMTEWREGAGGAVVMGLRHGAFCAGCCGALMGVLFVVGVMNLAWVAAIAVFVLVEKAIPRGRWVSRLSGAALCLWGLLLASSLWPR